MKEYAKRLRALRKEKGLTQQDVADRLRVNKQTISGYERGIRKPDFEKLDELADLFDVSIAYLVGSQEDRGAYPRHDYNVQADDGSWILVEAAYKKAPEAIRALVRRILEIEK